MEEEKVSNKIMISCREAGILSNMKEFDEITAWQKFQLGMHTFICGVCKVWKKQSDGLNKLVKSTFEKERYTCSEKKKAEMEKEIDQLFI